MIGRKRMKNIIYILLSAVILISCRTSPCPTNPSEGNAGSVINTKNDDYLPVAAENYLYFTSVRESKNKSERVYKSEIKNGDFLYPERDSIIPLDKYPNTGTPTFYIDPVNGYKEIYFAAIAPTGVANRDIYTANFADGEWSEPELLPQGVNSESYESHPFISPDGKYLVFSSDRPGGIGETDLYISRRLSDGSWSMPENLGSRINTPQQEISPCIAPDGTLYYASKGFNRNTGYDIIKAKRGADGQWTESKLMPHPINTKNDEQGPAVLYDQLLLSSNRSGGCGGYDIYSFELCGPIILTGRVWAESSQLPISGKLELFNQAGNKIGDAAIDESGEYEFHIVHSSDYLLKYYNNCLPDYSIEQHFDAPCSDSSVVKLIADFMIPEKLNMFSTDEQNIPFFVSGYYIPNTSENLRVLRNKFEMGYLGKADSTRYIENPGPEYNEYSQKVDEVLNEAVDFILSKLAYLKGGCTKGGEKLVVNIIGYADPRPISSKAKYSGATIDDPAFSFRIEQGRQMTNQLLSTLRAYYTAKYFQNILEKYDNYLQAKDRISWEISGDGVDKDNVLANEMKRRVDIHIGLRQP